MYRFIMKKFLFVLCLVFVIPKCFCFLPDNENRTNKLLIKPPNTCTFNGVILEKNQIIPARLGECYGIKCNSTLQLEDQLCEAAVVGKGCHGRSFNLSMRYPNCCPSAVCKN